MRRQGATTSQEENRLAEQLMQTGKRQIHVAS